MQTIQTRRNHVRTDSLLRVQAADSLKARPFPGCEMHEVGHVPENQRGDRSDASASVTLGLEIQYRF
jgi:hypothetical protein